MEEKTQTQDAAITEDTLNSLSALSGTGVDTVSLAEKIKKDAAVAGSADAGSVEPKPGPAAVSEPATKDPAPPGDVAVTFTADIKVGDEIKAGDTPAPDGDYVRADQTVVVIKDGKIESITPKAASSKTAPSGTIDNPFVGEESAVIEPADIKSFDEGASYLGEKLGLEIKSPGDFSKVVSRIDELNTSIGTMQEDMSKLADYKAVFENMPDDLFAITSKWLNEEDYHDEIQAVSRRNIDFSKSFSEHNLKDLIEHYNPGKFSEEDYLDMDDDRAMKAVADLTKQAYSADKRKYEGVKENHFKSVEATRKKFTASVDNSIAALASSVPYLKDHHKLKVASVLKNGASGILDLFVDNEGMLKPEAGKLVALAIYGDDAIAAQRKAGQNRGASKATEEIVRRTPTAAEKTNVSGGGAPDSAGAEILKKFKENVIPKQSDNPFMSPFVGV